MLVFKNIKNLQEHLSSISSDNTVGFVPTMGALHKGHLSLIKTAKEQTNIVVVSVFVNPTQFNKSEDLEKYPRNLELDLDLLKTVNCDVVFAPNSAEIYQNNLQSETFDFDGLENLMEGKFRKGHFDGVGTVVKRFFEIIKPTKAFFGEKDFQQLQIIKKMVFKHKILIEIVGCEIYRESDGLAMSSRNTLLTKEQRNAAPFIYEILESVKDRFDFKNQNEISNWVENQFQSHSVLNLEYFQVAEENSLVSSKHENVQYRAFIAVFADRVRLIDNIRL